MVKVKQEILDTDVFIVGAGPAGLAAAIAARQKGFRVVIADYDRFPIDKTCGEGLMPDGVLALRRLGVVLGPEDAVAFRGVRFLAKEASVGGTFPQGSGFGIRRTTLHRLLVARAEQVGASILWRTPVQNLVADGVSLDRQIVRCQWVIGADGLKSRVRQWAGLDGHRYHHRRFGVRRHFKVAPWTDHVEVYLGKDYQIFVTPISPEAICASLVSRIPQLRLEDAVSQLPELAGRLHGAPAITAERGAITATHSIAAVWRGRIALVGDASGSVDALTGKGLSLAFQQAVCLAEALAKNNLEFYQAAHKRIVRLPMLMSRLMLAMERPGWLRNRALHALASEPALFSRLLAIHVGALPPAALGLKGIFTLGWQFLTV